MLGMEPSPFQKFRDIIEFNYSPEEEEILDDEADEMMKGLDYQEAKRFADPENPFFDDGEFGPKLFDQDDEDWDFPDAPKGWYV